MSLSPRELLVSTMYHVDVIVDPQDKGVSRVIMDIGTWEPRNIRLMSRFVKTGSTVLNIGSHIGLEAIIMGKIAGPTGRLFVLEPNSQAYRSV